MAVYVALIGEYIFLCYFKEKKKKVLITIMFVFPPLFFIALFNFYCLAVVIRFTVLLAL